MKRRFFAIAAVLTLAAATFAHPAQAVEIITVTSMADSGPGTLRQAIIDANNDGDATIIDFSDAVFSGRISLTTTTGRLPPLLEPDTTIQGSVSEVSLDGSSLGDNSHGLLVMASNTVIRGLTIQDFPGNGIRIQPDGNSKTVTGVVIQNNTIKRNLDGLSVSGEGYDNVVGVMILGNTIQENGDDGIFVRGSSEGSSDGNNTIDVVIDGNTIDGSKGEVIGMITGDGVRVVSGFEDSMSNSLTAVISNNDIIASADQGIVAKGADVNGQTSKNHIDVQIYGNVVQDSGVEGSGGGIQVQGGHRPGNSGGTENTVYFSVYNNTVNGSTSHGISIFGGMAGENPKGGMHDVRGTVSDNIVRGNTKNGIIVSGGRADGSRVHDIVVEGNAIRNNGAHGILVIGGLSDNNNGVTGDNNVVENITIQRNITRLNGMSGLSVEVQLGNAVLLDGITDNTSVSNGGDGIQIGLGIPGDDPTPISENTASRNGEDGIDIDSGGYDLFNNRADRNTVDGINAGVSINDDDGGNTAQGNASCNTPGCYNPGDF